MRTPAYPALNIGASTSGFTIEFWMRRTSYSDGLRVMGWSGGMYINQTTSYGSGLYISRDGTTASPVNFATGGSDGFTVGNTWVHLAIVYNKATGVTTLYKNGVIYWSGSPGAYTTAGDFYLGGGYLGSLDEVSLYNRPLTQMEVAAVYTSGTKGKKPVDCTPVISPAAGNYSVPISATISSPSSTALIYYTTNGATPVPGNSLIYSEPITITQSTLLQCMGVSNGLSSVVSSAFYRIGSSAATVTPFSGLAGTYYQTADFGASSTRRIDVQLNSPSFTTLPTGWQGASGSARWEGGVLARFTENHTFTLNTNGGVRLWFDGQLVVDDWAGSTSRTLTFTRSLTAGSQYPLKVEFQRNSAAVPVLALQWGGFSTTTELVPQSQLVSGLAYASIAATPEATPVAGLYGANIAVALTTTVPTSGARFYYTLDGSEPTDASALYTGPLTLSQNTTLKAKTYANGYVESGTLVANYTFDNLPPVLSNPTFNGGAVTSPLTTNGTFGITATDASGVKRVDFQLDGVLLASDTVPADGFTAPFAIEPTTDGAHTLTVQAWDNANTPSAVLSVPLTVALPAPLAPEITSPASNAKVNRESLTLRGTAQANSLVTLYRGGSSLGTATAGADGSFSLAITLVPGQNDLTTTARNRNPAASAASAVVSVTYDNTVPAPPTGLTATQRSAGRIELSWLEPTSGLANGYYLFRSTAPIAANAELLPANAIGGLLRSRTYTDTPSSDGRYYYRALTAYSVGSDVTLSVPSNQADAFSDRLAPTATVTLQPLGSRYDSAAHRFGPGLVQATVTVSERLAAAPFFNLTTTGSPLFVDLAAQGETTYTGVFTLQDTTASGPVGAVFSALDVPGNRGTVITLATPAVIDTDGPSVTGLTPVALTETGTEDLPAYNSIRNDPVAPATSVTLHWRLTLDEAPKPGTQPALSATFSGTPATALPLTLTDAGDTYARTWLASLVLPATAGADVETLTLNFTATDDLDNIGQTITPPHTFQVYQGQLPPLAVPAGLTAEALPAGEIYLDWEPVAGASAYVLQVKGPADADFADLEVLVSSATAHTYTPATDGLHSYRLASVRSENGQDSNSGWSNIATARADRVPPPAPANLVLTVVPQGVKAVWSAPAAGLSDVAGYALYRDDAVITSIEGLTPAVASIPSSALIAVDASPAGTTPYYGLVSYDAAGNRSEPATAFANVSLLPVRTLSVVQSAAGAAPIVSWTPAPGSVIDGFRLAIDGSLIAVAGNESIPAATRTYTDTGYTAGDRLYLVTTVSGPETRERSLLMPAVSLSLAAGSELKRGLMNTLTVLVRNDSTTTITDARLVVRVAGRDHASSAFITLAGGAQTTVPVVIGGYDDLPSGTAPVTLTLTITPNTGETVTHVRSATAAVAEGALTVELLPGKFTRGGTGKLRFKLTNPGTQPIEFITAQAQGAQASADVRLKVSDASGSLLSTTPMLLLLGDNVVALPGGVTVVRVPAGATYTSPEISVPVPASAPATVTASLEIDSVYYDYGVSGSQVKLAGPRAQATASTLETSYEATLATITPPESNGDVPVTISGQANWRSADGLTPGAAASGVAVVVSIRNNGFVRTQTVYSDANGAFAYAFQPGATEAGGIYDVWVSHPDAPAAPATPAVFTVRRVLVSPQVFNMEALRNYRQTLPVTVSTGAGTSVQNLRAELVETLPEAFSITTTPLTFIAPSQKVSLPLSFVGLASTAASTDTGTLHFKVRSDDGQGGTLEWATLTLNYRFNQANPSVLPTPTQGNIGVQPGQTASETILLKNQGYAAFEGGQLSLVPQGSTPIPSWIRLLTPSALDLIDIGGTQSVVISAAPPVSGSLVDEVYQFYLRVTGTNIPSIDIPVRVVVSPSGQGGALLKIVDPYYQLTLPEGVANPSFNGLVNVPVILEKESSTGIATVTRNLSTDAAGEVYFDNLPSGRYKLRITSPKHDTYEARVTIKPGVIYTEQIQMTYKPVTFTWEVVPVTFQDRYEVNITTTFETNVPVPVVVVEPGAINLPKLCAGQVYSGEFRITNHGLIAADNVTIPVPPSDEYFSYELMTAFGGRVAAGQTVKVAYQVKCLKALPGDCPESSPTGGSNGGDGTVGDVPCSTYSKCFVVTYHYVCANGLPFSSTVTTCIYRAFGKCAAVASGGGAGSPPFNGGYGGTVTPYTGGGGGSGFVLGSSTVASDDCFPRLVGRSCGAPSDGSGGDCDPTASPMRKGCSTGADGGVPGDPVLDNLIGMEELVGSPSFTSRQYTGDYEDMSIPVPGGSVSIGGGIRGQNASSSTNDRVRAVSGAQGFALVRNGTAYLPVGQSMGDLSSESGAALVAQSSALAPAAVYRENGGLDTITKQADGSLVLTKPNGDTIGYDAEGRMISRGTRAGLFAGYHYAADGTLSHITDRNDITVANLTYADGRLTGVIDAANRQVSYTYDIYGRMATATDLVGTVTTYTYDNWSQVTGVRRHIAGTDAAQDEVVAIQYHTIAPTASVVPPPDRILSGSARAGDPLRGYVTSISKTVNGVTSTRTFNYKYNAADQTYYTRVVTSTGREEEFLLNASGTLISKRVNGQKVYSMEEDARVRVTTIGENQRITEEYDDGARLVRRVNPDGGIERWTHDPVLNKILTYTDPLGNVTAHTYDALGNVLTQTEAVGTALQRVTVSEYYPGTTLIKKRTETDGRQTAYEYDANDRVLRTYDPLAPARQTSYTYDTLGRIASETDALGRVTSFLYDAEGHVIEQTDALGQKTLHTYSGDNLVQTEEGRTATSAGVITRYTYDAAGRRLQQKRVDAAGVESVYRSFTYDSEGKMLSETNALGQTVSYGYDAADNPVVLRVPDADGGVSEAFTSYDTQDRAIESIDPMGKRITTQYDPMGRPKLVTEAAGTPLARATTYSYDLMGRTLEEKLTSVAEPANVSTLTNSYDSLGRLTAAAGSLRPPVTYTYDAADRIVSETDALGRVTTYLYDAHGQLESERINGQTIALYAYDLVGNRIAVTDALGNHRHFRYDALNRVTHESIALNPSQAPPAEWWTQASYVLQATTYTPRGKTATTTRYTVEGAVTRTVTNSYTYDAFDRLVAEIDAAGLTVTHVYDAADGLQQTIYPPVASSGEVTPTSITYLRSPHNAAVVSATVDRAGNTTHYVHDKNFRVVEETNSLGGVTRTTYDVLNRVTKVVQPGGETTETAYDYRGLPIRITHPDHVAGTHERIEQLAYDAYGRLTQKTGAGEHPMTYRYDLVGNLLEQQDANGKITRWTYTARNEVASKIYADTTAHVYTYDAAGRLATRKDALNRTTTYGYNAAGQITLIDYPTDADVTYTYDQQGRSLGMMDGSGTTTWTHDALGRPASETQGRSGRTLTYGYDSYSRRATLAVTATGAQPWTTRFGYDNSGRLRTVLDDRLTSGQPYIYGYATNASLVTQVLGPTGLNTNKTYDNQGRLLTQISTLNSGPTVLSTHTYTYDAAGQRSTEVADDRTRTFTYDAWRQLTAVATAQPSVNDEIRSYAYDAIGNRLTAETSGPSPLASGLTTYTPNAVNQYETITGALTDTPAYDLNGNTTGQRGKTLRYDEENRLVEVYDLTTSVIYIYDGLGRRVERIEHSLTGGGTTGIRYVYDGMRVIEELDASTSATLRSYTRGLDLAGSLEGAGGIGGLLAMSQPSGASWTTSSYIHDGSGNVTHLVSTSGAIVARYTYGPFGERLTATGALADVNPYQFSGKERDAVTGYYHYGYRSYDPLTARWLSRDPLGEQGGANLYGFNRNSPINYFDAAGEIPVPVATAIIGGVIGGVIQGGVAYLKGGSTKDIVEASIKGALEGAVAGFAAGLFPGSGLPGFMASGFLSDAAAQHAMMALGLQDCYSLWQGLLSAALGGIAGELAPGVSKYADDVLDATKAAAKYSNKSVQQALRDGLTYLVDVAKKLQAVAKQSAAAARQFLDDSVKYIRTASGNVIASSKKVLTAVQKSVRRLTNISDTGVARIHIGHGNNMAVIGRSMNYVRDTAASLKAGGATIELFEGRIISKAAQAEWDQLISGLKPGQRLADAQLLATKMFQENLAWAQKLVREGYTVIDAGAPAKSTASVFYDMEQLVIFGSKN
jgi:large repetitive protein